MRVNFSEKGFVLLAVLISILLLTLLYGFMQENLRLANFVKWHADQYNVAQKNCNRALKNIMQQNNVECKHCQIQIGQYQFDYSLQKIMLDNPGAQRKKFFTQLQLNCSDGHRHFGTIQAVIDPQSKNILSWKWA